MVIASFGWWLITILAGDDLNYLLVSFCTYRYKFCCIFWEIKCFSICLKEIPELKSPFLSFSFYNIETCLRVHMWPKFPSYCYFLEIHLILNWNSTRIFFIFFYSHKYVHACHWLHLCLTLCIPMNCSPPGSSVHGDSPIKNTGVGCHALLQGIFPCPGIEPTFLTSPALAGRLFTTSVLVGEVSPKNLFLKQYLL